MAKWKCEVCGNEFENFHAQGFDNKIYCPLCYFKKENQELKLELSGYRQAILEDKEMLGLKEENDKLKKQLEEYKEQVHKGLYNVCLPYKTGYNKAIKDKEIQQKEFIKWLEDYLNLFDNMDIDEQISYDTIEEILQKYKSIIGDDK